MRSILALSSALLLASVAHAAVSFTQPITSTIWKTGDNVTITWIAANGTQLSSNPVSFELLYGNPNALTLVLPNITSAPENAGRANYTVPRNIPTGNQYALRAGGQSGTYSAMFTIVNTNGTSANGTTPNNGTAATPTTNGTNPAKTTPTPTPSPSATTKSNANRVASTGALLIAAAAVVGMF